MTNIIQSLTKRFGFSLTLVLLFGLFYSIWMYLIKINVLSKQCLTLRVSRGGLLAYLLINWYGVQLLVLTSYNNNKKKSKQCRWSPVWHIHELLQANANTILPIKCKIIKRHTKTQKILEPSISFHEESTMWLAKFRCGNTLYFVEFCWMKLRKRQKKGVRFDNNTPVRTAKSFTVNYGIKLWVAGFQFWLQSEEIKKSALRGPAEAPPITTWKQQKLLVIPSRMEGD